MNENVDDSLKLKGNQDVPVADEKQMRLSEANNLVAQMHAGSELSNAPVGSESPEQKRKLNTLNLSRNQLGLEHMEKFKPSKLSHVLTLDLSSNSLGTNESTAEAMTMAVTPPPAATTSTNTNALITLNLSCDYIGVNGGLNLRKEDIEKLKPINLSQIQTLDFSSNSWYSVSSSVDSQSPERKRKLNNDGGQVSDDFDNYNEDYETIKNYDILDTKSRVYRAQKETWNDCKQYAQNEMKKDKKAKGAKKPKIDKAKYVHMALQKYVDHVKTTNSFGWEPGCPNPRVWIAPDGASWGNDRTLGRLSNENGSKNSIKTVFAEATEEEIFEKIERYRNTTKKSETTLLSDFGDASFFEGVDWESNIDPQQDGTNLFESSTNDPQHGTPNSIMGTGATTTLRRSFADTILESVKTVLPPEFHKCIVTPMNEVARLLGSFVDTVPGYTNQVLPLEVRKHILKSWGDSVDVFGKGSMDQFHYSTEPVTPRKCSKGEQQFNHPLLSLFEKLKGDLGALLLL